MTDSVQRQPNRRSIRLQEYDYAQAGAYFVTICTHNRECLFGEIVDGEVRLNDAGRMIQAVWDGLPERFDNLGLDQFTIMPNHVHGIMVLNRRGESRIRPVSLGQRRVGERVAFDQVSQNRTSGDYKDRPCGTLPDTVGRIIQAFKSISTYAYVNGVKRSGWPRFSGKLWQRNYWEHIVRDESERDRIREYICNNPMQWELDPLNPRNEKFVTTEIGS